MTTTKHDDRKHIADLITEAKVAMLTTTTPEGRHVSRPMALQEADFDGDLWFFADEDSAKATQIAASPEVGVSFSDSQHHTWTSIAGRASIVRDRAKAEQLYTPVLKAWFPDGLDTPGLALIKVETDTAEYWEAPTSTTAFALGTLRAAITGNPAKDPITNETVDL